MAAASCDCRAHSPAHCQPAGVRPLPMCRSPTPLALWEGWAPLKLVSVLFPLPRSLLKHPSHLLPITVPLSPVVALPSAWSRSVQCLPSRPVLGAGMEAAGALKSRSERAGMRARSVPSSGPAQQRCPGLGEGRAFPRADFRAIPWGAGPGAGATRSNNPEPLPAVFYAGALRELPKLRLGGAGGPLEFLNPTVKFPLVCSRCFLPERSSEWRGRAPIPHPLFPSSLRGAGFLCKYLNSASVVS